MSRHRHPRRLKRAQGFSGLFPPTLLKGMGVGQEKRQTLNRMSRYMVLCAALGGAGFGYSMLGAFGAISGAAVASILMAGFVLGGRYMR